MSELISCFHVISYLLSWDLACDKEVCVKDLDRPIGSRQKILHRDLKPHEIRDRPPSLEEQAGFRNGRSCNKQIFTLWNILEQCKEFQKSLQLTSSISKRPLTVYTASQSGKSWDFMAFPTRSSIYSYLCTPTADAVCEPKTATLTCLTSLQVSDKAASFLNSYS